jgi:hypothetical protein
MNIAQHNNYEIESDLFMPLSTSVFGAKSTVLSSRQPFSVFPTVAFQIWQIDRSIERWRKGNICWARQWSEFSVKTITKRMSLSFWNNSILFPNLILFLLLHLRSPRRGNKRRSTWWWIFKTDICSPESKVPNKQPWTLQLKMTTRGRWLFW